MRRAVPVLVVAVAAALAGSCADDALRNVDTPDAGSRSARDAGSPADGGCVPPVTEQSLTTTDSSHTFDGAGPASSTGTVVVSDAGGESLDLPVATNASGAWSITVPLFCGEQTIDVRFEATCAPETRIHVTRTDCAAPDLQVTLTWDDKGFDWELHLVKQGGRINDNATDCTWTSCIHSSPDWGVQGDPSDDPHKDVDNTGAYGPENIYLNKPENISYTVLVEHWGGGAADSSGQVTVLLKGASPVVIPINDLAPQHVAIVAKIDWPSRTVTPISTIYDCSGNWSGGCRDPLP